jgi:hypothetical protein
LPGLKRILFEPTLILPEPGADSAQVSELGALHTEAEGEWLRQYWFQHGRVRSESAPGRVRFQSVRARKAPGVDGVRRQSI